MNTDTPDKLIVGNIPAEPGYYWYKTVSENRVSGWKICLIDVDRWAVHFIGECHQEIKILRQGGFADNPYLKKYVHFGPKAEPLV